MKIIIDAMGGDNAPFEIVKGCALALNEFSDINIVFTGDKQKIEAVLNETNCDKNRVEIIHTTQVIEMADSAVKSIKEKPDSSMVVALKKLSEYENSIVISAGNTGALVAGATLIVRRLDGIKRPALAPTLPTKKGPVLLMDAGANADCKPQYLNQFAIMGSMFMSKVYGLSRPRVALINNGSEEEKGSELTKAAYKLIKESPVNFSGNVEGRDLLSGEFDVLVCDGYTGNIVLKLIEGCSKTIFAMLKENIMQSISAKIGALLMKGAFSKLKKKMDYKEYGGALLLGLRGGVMKAHGSSDSRAIVNAIATARKFIAGNVVEEIKTEIAQVTEKQQKSE